MSTIKVRFLIDTKKHRVVFAEAGRDFVDLLFSFLTLPLGRIVQLLGKHSGLRSLDNLYESVEQLNDKHLQTKECKDMLLNPRSAAARQYEDLKIKGIHELNPRIFYTCSQDNCLIQSTCYYTYTSKSQCSRCDKLMVKVWEWNKLTSEKGGVFLVDTTDFIIMDDLQVTPLSSRNCLSLFQQLQIKDSSVLEKKEIEFGTREALNLLKTSLISKNALTDYIYFLNLFEQINGDFFLPIKEEFAVGQENQLNLELVLNKNNNEVLYAEVGDDFVNQFVSFLTFPIGSVLKVLSGNLSSLGIGVQNLYSSAERMNLDLFKSEICRNMLLTPTLPNFYGINNQLLEFEEIASENFTVANSCAKCLVNNEYKTCKSGPCIHGVIESKFIEQNPKVSNGASDNDRAFVVSSRRFMVSDDLHISPLSVISAMSNEKNLPISDFVRREVSMNKVEVIFLMSTMLISKRLLTDVFSPKLKPPKRSIKL